MFEEQGELATQSTQQEEPQDLRSVLESAIDQQEAPQVEAEEKPTRARDEAGRFTAAELAQQAAAKEAEKPVEQAPVEQSAKKAPSSWKKEAAAEFDKLPPHVQDEVLRRETDFHKGIEGFKSHADLGRTIERTLQPYMQTIQQLGVSPDVAISSLLKADAGLRYGTPEQKAAHLASLAQTYGIDIGQVAQVPQKDPYTLQLEQQLNQLKQQSDQIQQSQQERERETLNSEIQRVREKLGDSFDVLKDDAAALLQAGRATDLDDAFEKAQYANPQTRQALLEQQKQEALKQANAAALANRAKAASVSVRGSSPASGSGAAPSSLRAALESAYNG